MKAHQLYKCQECSNCYSYWYSAKTCHDTRIQKVWQCGKCKEIYYNIYDAFNCCYDEEIVETPTQWLDRNYPQYNSYR